ncbi:hypothetical protein JCM8547_007304 [Rhodosporidiobolus lusitaniae]
MSDIPERPDFSHFTAERVSHMEEITYLPALQLIEQSGILSASIPDGSLVVLDGAAGGGIVTAVLKEKLAEGKKEGGEKVKVVMGDVEEGMVELAKKRAVMEGWKNVEVKVVDGQAMDSRDAFFDYIFVNCGFQLFPNPDEGVKEAARLLKDGGLLAYSAWTSVAFFRLLRLADPSIPLPPFMSLPLVSTTEAPSYFAQYGLRDVHFEPVLVKKSFKSAEDAVGMVKKVMPDLFGDEERNRKIVERLREEDGDGELVLEWEGVTVTARKA